MILRVASAHRLAIVVGVAVLVFVFPASAAVEHRAQGTDVAVTAAGLSCVVQPTGMIRDIAIAGVKVIDDMHVEVRDIDGRAYQPQADTCRPLEVREAFGGIAIKARGTVAAPQPGIQVQFVLEVRFVEDGLATVEAYFTPLADFQAETIAYMVYLPVALYQDQEIEFRARTAVPGPQGNIEEGQVQYLKWPVALLEQNQFQWFVTRMKHAPKGGPSYEIICRQGNSCLEDLRKKNIPYYNVGCYCGYDYQKIVRRGDTRSILVAIRPESSNTNPEAIDSGPAWDQAHQDFRFATQLLANQEYEIASRKFREFIQKHPNHREVPVAQLRLGECLFQLKQYPAARTEFGNFITQNPESEQRAAVRSRIAECYYREGSFQEAIKTYAEVVTQDNPTTEIAAAAFYWKGESHFQLNELDNAIKDYQACVDTFPDSKYGRYALYSIAVSLVKKGQHAEALARFAEVIQKYPNTELVPQCLLGMADAQYAAGSFAEALASYQRVQKEHPQVSPEKALYGIAWSQYELKQYPAALTSFRELAAKYGDTVYVPEALLQAGHCLFHQEQYQEAFQEYAKCAALHQPKFSDEALFWQGQAMIKLDRLQDALTPLQSLVNDYPQSPRVATAKEQIAAIQKKLREGALIQVATQADELFRQGQYREALAKFQETLKQNPEGEVGEHCRLRVGMCQEKLGQPDQALSTYLELLAASPNSKLAPHAMYQIAWLHHDAKRTDDEAKAWRELAEKHPDSPLAPEAWFRLGELAFEHDKLDEAVAAYSQLVAKYPQADTKDEALYKRAWSYLKQGKWQEGAADFVQAGDITDKPEVAADAKYEAGVCYQRLNQPDQALRQFERCAADHPASDRAPLALVEAAQIYAERREYTKVEQLTGQVLQQHANSPSAARAHLLAGIVRQLAKDTDTAMKHFEAATVNAPDPVAAEAQARLGECYFDKQQWEQALEAYLRVTLLYKGETLWAARAQYGIGEVREKQDQKDAAIEAYKKAAGYTGTDWAQKATQRLGQLGGG